MDQQDFQEQVIDSLATLKESSLHTVKHLEKLNGKVAEHEKQIHQHYLEYSKFATSVLARQHTSANWWNKLMPVLYVIGGAFVFLVLKDAPALTKFFGGN